MKVYLTVDVEPDCPPYLNTFRGIEEGMDRLLGLLDEEGIKATFFTTGHIAREYPEAVERIVSLGHEIGSHGDIHEDFETVPLERADQAIGRSVETLREFAPVTSFRAPYLKFPDPYLRLLEVHGFHTDSSQAKYKLSHYHRSRSFDPPTRIALRGSGNPGQAKPDSVGLKRLPVSTTSSAIRLPYWVLIPYLNRLISPVVLFVHPWEYVDLRGERLRWDCRFKTGKIALDCLRAVIEHFRAKQACFLRVADL